MSQVGSLAVPASEETPGLGVEVMLVAELYASQGTVTVALGTGKIV